MTGTLVWLTGRPGAGKSTLGSAVTERLCYSGLDAIQLDGDELRHQIAVDLGFDEHDRDLFYDRVVETAANATRYHDVVVVSATAPRARYRDAARARVQHFVEVFVTASEATLRARDPKGLYAAADKHEVTNLPGVDSCYEAPLTPDVVCDTEHASSDALAARISAAVRAIAATGQEPR